MWLSGMQTPDFNTINLFRRNRLADVVDGIFTQVVRMLVDARFISLDVQYVDGTKIESSANKYTFVWKKATKTNQGKLDLKVKAILAEAERVLGMEMSEEKDAPMSSEEMKDRTERVLEEMDRKGLSDKNMRKAVKKVKEESVAKMKEYEDKLDTLGERNSYSKTDPDATFMHMKEDAMNNGQTKPGYNIQISTENQFITNFTLSWRPTDWGTFKSHMEKFKERYGRHSGKVVADSGYGNEENYDYMEDNGIEAFVKYTMFHREQKRDMRNNPFRPENMHYNAEEDYYVCPMGQHLTLSGVGRRKTEMGYAYTVSYYEAQDCSGCPMRGMCYKAKANRRTIEVNHRNDAYKAKARERLMSEEGLYHRSMRPIEPEAVFGQLKYDDNFKRFHYKGNRLVGAEFATLAIAHNIKKLASALNGPNGGHRRPEGLSTPGQV